MSLGKSCENTQPFYKYLVWELFEKKSSERISCGDALHASLVIEAMLVYATQKARIFTENLAAEVYGRSELLQALEQALRRNIIIEVLTQKQPTTQEFTGIIQKDAGKLGTVKVAQTQYGKNRPENFAVMDMQAFRYVPNKEKLRGFASANDRTSAAILDSNFTRLLTQEL